MSGITIAPVEPPKMVLTTTPEQRVNLTAPQQKVNLSVPTGPPGPRGPAGKDALWAAMTQEEYDTLLDKDPGTLYVIVP